MSKHTVIAVVATLAVVALGGYMSVPLLSTITNTVANKHS